MTAGTKTKKVVLARIAVAQDYDEGHYIVSSASRAGQLYHVSVSHQTCSCPGSVYRGQCPHVALALEQYAQDRARRGMDPQWLLDKHQYAQDRDGFVDRLQTQAGMPPPPRPVAGSGAAGLLEAFGIAEEGWS